MKKIKSLLLSVLSLMSLVGVAQPCTVLADETQSTDINIETQAANIDITIPSTLEWTFNADGTNTLPDNWSITNNSAVDVMLDTVTINGENGWSLVNEQPTVDNTKAIVLTIDNVSQSNGVYTLSTELAKNGGTHKLSYDVKRANFTSNGIVNSQKAYTATLAFSYSKENFTVTFDANEGTLSSNTRSVEDGSTIGTLPTPTRNYYTFLGWYTQAEGGEQITKDTVITENLTVYAHWNEILYGYKDVTSYEDEYVSWVSGGSYYREEAILLEDNFSKTKPANKSLSYWTTFSHNNIEKLVFDVTTNNTKATTLILSHMAPTNFTASEWWTNENLSLSKDWFSQSIGFYLHDDDGLYHSGGSVENEIALPKFKIVNFSVKDSEGNEIEATINIKISYRPTVYYKAKDWSDVIVTSYSELPKKTTSRMRVYSKDNGNTWKDCYSSVSSYSDSCPIK